MTLPRTCCSTCNCPSLGTQVSWSGSISFAPDSCSCTNFLGSVQGVRVDPFTLSDGPTRTLNSFSYCTSYAQGYGSQTVPFNVHYSASCISQSCPTFSCTLAVSVTYFLSRRCDKLTLTVEVQGMGRALSNTQNGTVIMKYQAPYASCTLGSPVTLTYIGTSFSNGDPASVGSCANWVASGLWYMSQISAITPGTVVIS